MTFKSIINRYEELIKRKICVTLLRIIRLLLHHKEIIYGHICIYSKQINLFDKIL